MSTPKEKDLPASVTASSLRALAEGKTDGISKQTIFHVDPELVEFEPDFNLRTKDDLWGAHVDRLYLAMRAGAAVPPIDVRVSAGKIICVDGEGRTTAAMRMREEFPDFKLQARQFAGNEQERVLHMLGTGSGQKSLTPLEQGLGFLRLTRYGMTPSEIAAKLGISTMTVQNNLVLAEAPVEVQNLVRQGVVSSTTAREAISQGLEGVTALREAAAAAQAAPAATTKAGKQSSKKKVTAQKLAGTAADKKTKPKKPAAKKTIAQWEKKLKMGVPIPSEKDKPTTKEAYIALAPVLPSPVAGEQVNAGNIAVFASTAKDEIMVKVKKADAQAVAEFLRSNAPDEATALKEFAAALEMALL